MQPDPPGAPAPELSHTTLIRAPEADSHPTRRTATWTLPPDLLAEATRRLRASALLYAGAYFLAGFVPNLILTERQGPSDAETTLYIAGGLSIAGALALAWLTTLRGVSPRAKMLAGLAFEVLGSYGIAAAEFHGIAAPISLGPEGYGGFGLSWVAVWVLLFSVVVPTLPRIAVVTAALAVTSVPVTYAVGVALGVNVPLPGLGFFLLLVFPYLVVVMMAYVGARVVYGLGAAVREARELGSYRLTERLGAGGMGEVWRAEHRMLARPAAIKLIRPEVLGATDPRSRQLFLRRFEREAQAIALMRSAHTMQLYDFGVADDGTFYYVMELLAGFDLDALVRRFGPVPPERAVHFLLQVCDSLAEAHEAGLIHRDVKPANIYVCRYGREVDHVKVLDFGLVTHGRRGTDGDTLAPGEVTGGTPAFMSPEQAADPERVDARSDLYSLGCVAYWLLTGTYVFRGTTPLETVVMHVNREPEPPSRRITTPIPPDLEAVVLDCLAKDPNARPHTADELAARLAAVRLERRWTADRAHEWWDRNFPGRALPRPDEVEAVAGRG